LVVLGIESGTDIGFFNIVLLAVVFVLMLNSNEPKQCTSVSVCGSLYRVISNLPASEKEGVVDCELILELKTHTCIWNLRQCIL
jgi:hypothetical protein